MNYPTPKGNVTSEVAVCWLVVKGDAMMDWPQWRADEWRSGFTTMKLPAALHLQWRRDFPRTRSPFAAEGKDTYADIDYCRPVQLGKTIFVPVTASDALVALDTETGAIRWRFYASGAVRRPPVALALAGGRNLVIFGSDDGWLYALNADDGSVCWKFRAAPNNRKALGFGRLSSVWPIWASPVAAEGKIYVVAGYLPAFGLFGYCLDAATGAVIWENDGRIMDVWNTSTFGPLAMSFDRSKLYGTVEGACTPWVLDASSGTFLGHIGVGFSYPGATRVGVNGWYVDGRGTCGVILPEKGADRNTKDPVTITAGAQQITPASVAALGVKGRVASLLAGDGKLFVTTAEGALYCFGNKAGQPMIHPWITNTPPNVEDGWAAVTKTMLSRKDLTQGLALVCGLGSGRLAEELVRQSGLVVVAVDPDHDKLQAFRAKLDAAGIRAARVSTLEGKPLDFGFAPYQAALIVSEDLKAAGFPAAGAGQKAAVGKMVGTWFDCLRPLGGELWLPTSDEQHALVAGWAAASSNNLPLSAVARQAGQPGAAAGFTQIKRQGLAADKLRLAPPFGLAAFTCRGEAGPAKPDVIWAGHDTYTWLPQAEPSPGQTPHDPGIQDAQIFNVSWNNEWMKTTKLKWNLSTTNSIFTRLPNPLYGLTEKFSGLPDCGVALSCGRLSVIGDIGICNAKLNSFFDASEGYFGRFFIPGFGGCPGFSGAGSGIFLSTSFGLPGNFCGCSANMEFTDIILVPMAGEESWMAYQSVRTSRAVDELPIRQIGVNFGAPGDRYVREEGTLWTHHPYAGLQGRHSHSPDARPEILPMVPVSYRGNAVSVYRHSASMERNSQRDRNWVAASYVKGMTEIAVPLAQPAVALRAAVAPVMDGKLNDACWDGRQRLVILPQSKVSNPGDTYSVMFRYDDTNLYVIGEAYAWMRRWPLLVQLNNREQVTNDVVVGCYWNSYPYPYVTKGIPEKSWSCASSTNGAASYSEIAIPWKVLDAAGLWREQLVVSVSVNYCPLVAAGTTPLYLDAARGLVAGRRPYTVRLTFAEMEGKKPGERMFDVSLQGKTALTKFDVVKEAGGPKRELTREFKGIDVSDWLTIGFAPAAGEPMLSGVEIIGEYQLGEHTPNALPMARIEASALSGPAPLAVTFSARGSQDPDGQIVQCAWDTGDGRLARGSLLPHVYAEPGTYKVHLLVRDNRGGMAATQTTITVTPGVPAAFACSIRAKGGDYNTLSAWEAAIRSDLTASNSLLFAVKSRGTYAAAADDGAAVTFTGGGKGALMHINGANVAYITGCTGVMQAGPMSLASGHTFEVADGGHPIYTAVAEGYNDWPGGLVDSISAPPTNASRRWVTDPLRCVTIRAAAGQGHRGALKDAKGSYTGFAFTGRLDATGMPGVRVFNLIVDPGSALLMGKGSSLSRTLAGEVTLNGYSMAANVVATSLASAGAPGFVNYHPSFYSMLSVHMKQGKTPNANVSFYNCTAATFDSADQSETEFINCLATVGGKGFHDDRYSDGAYASHCVSADASAVRWDSGDGSEGNAVSQIVHFVNAAAGDYHLQATDKGARGRGVPGLGADIDGEERAGPPYDVGADAAGRAGSGK
jgi:outer membrane protein assembly factor BamB